MENKNSELIFENRRVEVYTIPLDHRIYCNGYLFKEKKKDRHLNMEEIESNFKLLKEEAQQFIQDKSEDILKEIHKKVNEEVNKFSRIQMVVLQLDPFEKTPTKKIKRFLYAQ